MQKTKNDFLKPKTRQKKNSQKNKPRKRKLDALLSWKIKDFDNPTKSLRFFIVFYVFLFLIAIYGLITNNLLLSILVILFGFVFFVLEKKEPEDILFAITKEGIFIKDQLYKFSEIKNFWIVYEEDEFKEISFLTKNFLSPYIKIPLEKNDPTKVRKILIKFIPEEEHEKNLFDFLDRF